MTASKDNKQAKTKKATTPSKSKVKKEGTRVNTKVDVRAASKGKGGGKASRDRLRDGT